MTKASKLELKFKIKKKRSFISFPDNNFFIRAYIWHIEIKIKLQKKNEIPSVKTDI